MTEKSIKILEKRLNCKGVEEYLIEYNKSDDKTADEWKSLEQLEQLTDYRQLVNEFNGNIDKTVDNCVEIDNNNENKDLNQSSAEEQLLKKNNKNGFDRGYRPFKILGAKHDKQNQLMFLVMFKEDLTKADLIPNYVLHQKCPQLLIKFYEKNTLWKR